MNDPHASGTPARTQASALPSPTRVAVTGALGIVGAIVAADLHERGHEVVAIDRSDSSAPRPYALSRVDLTGYEDAVEALRGVDAVVHLAAINNPVTEPDWRVHSVNVTSSYNVLAAAAHLGVPRLVQASSVNAIGMAWSRHPQFDYLPVDLDHPSRPEDAYSLSKQIQELQADAVVRAHPALSVASLRLHAVLHDAADAQSRIDRFGMSWAVNGLFGYCTHASVATAFAQALTAPIEGHERLWVVEPETFSDEPSADLVRRHYPTVPLRRALAGRESLIDASRTRALLSWTPSTAV